jgi:GntR family transcriptional repressor for pyruvate dehydrogenase complex
VTKAAVLADELVRQIEGQIRRGLLPPGTRVPTEHALADQFDVSRTVVREAFARLAARGLILSRRGSGAYVADEAMYRAFQVTAGEISNLEDVIALLELRIGFEAEMAELAATRHSAKQLDAIAAAQQVMKEAGHSDDAAAADAAFHGAIAEATGNAYFIRFTEFLGVRLVPSRQLYLGNGDRKASRRYADLINRDHDRILAAIAARDSAGARRAARRHIINSILRHKRQIDLGAFPGE